MNREPPATRSSVSDVGDGNANRVINFIEAAYIRPVNKAQST